MHALRRAHQAVVPGGALLDIHPVASRPPVEAAGAPVGRLDDRGWSDVIEHADARLAELVAEGLLEDVRTERAEVRERFRSAEEFLEAVADWPGTRIPRRLRARVRGAEPPIDVREQVVYRLLRRR